MPAPSSQSLRVAECNACQQLFAVYETSGVVSCPGCQATVELASLEVAEIGVAAPAVVEVEPHEEPQHEVSAEQAAVEKEVDTTGVESSMPELEAFPEPMSHPIEPKKAVEDRGPTVAEWLLRGGDPHVAASAGPEPKPTAEPAENLAGEPAAKPSLSESLGWKPADFGLDRPTGIDEPVDESHPGETPPEPEPATSSDEFRFDFGATPLAEQGSSEPVSLDLSSAPEPAVADEAAQPAGLDWTAPEPLPRKSWSGPLSAVAGILLVAAPAAWMVVTWPDESELTAAANRQQRDLMAADEEMPPNPYPPAADRVAGTSGERLASFEADVEPLSTFEEEEAAPASEKASEPASFSAPVASEPPAFEPEPSVESPIEPAATDAGRSEPNRYAPAGDRYASVEPLEEPGTFSLPEDTPAAPTPEPRIEIPTEAELINVPFYGLGELQKAIAGGGPAGEAFAVGTLSDPAQASEMGKNYARLCYLAQVLTLLDPQERGPGVMTTELEATDVFNRLFREAQPRVESQQIAGPWMAWTGRPHGGVFFSGTPVDMRQAGSAAEYVFEVGGQRVPVLSPERLEVTRFINAGSNEIGVIGILVDNPRERIAGYEGDADRVVWVRKTLALRAPVEL